tara:strand:- start:8770 stop:8994 length:225 start_codon:yes stop_codon:yes gene_type:complete
MRKWAVVANMTSVVFCDDDGEANFVEHFFEGMDLQFNLTGEEVGKGYFRATMPNGIPIIIFYDDWRKTNLKVKA